jgi:hypothetical protein
MQMNAYFVVTLCWNRNTLWQIEVQND